MIVVAMLFQRLQSAACRVCKNVTADSDAAVLIVTPLFILTPACENTVVRCYDGVALFIVNKQRRLCCGDISKSLCEKG